MNDATRENPPEGWEWGNDYSLQLVSEPDDVFVELSWGCVVVGAEVSFGVVDYFVSVLKKEKEAKST